MFKPIDEVLFEGYWPVYQPNRREPPLGTSGSNPSKSVKVKRFVPL